MLFNETAEDVLSNLRARLAERAEAASLYAEIHAHLPEPLRIRLMGPLDEAREMARAVAALDLAIELLAKPLEPLPDDRRK